MQDLMQEKLADSYSSVEMACPVGHTLRTFGNAYSNALMTKAFLEMHAGCRQSQTGSRVNPPELRNLKPWEVLGCSEGDYRAAVRDARGW